MKKILGFVLILGFLQASFATNFYNPQDRSFKAGFEAGLKALEYQRLTEGVQPREVNLGDSFYLSVDIKNMPLPEILFLQNISAREGYKSYLTRNFLVFTDFKRKADALETQRQLAHHYKIDSKIYQSKNTKLITYPILWGEFYRNFLNDVQQNGYAIKVEVIEVPKVVHKVVKVYSDENQASAGEQKLFGTIINAKAMSYTLKGSKNLSKSFKENGFVERQEFDFGNEKQTITASGETFYKVKNQNLYFSTKDIRLQK